MKKLFLLMFSAALLFAGCQKENVQGLGSGGQEVTFTLSTESVVSKGLQDGDGAAANINHWVMEVRDSDGDVFSRKEDDATAGELTHSFTVKLIKGQTYNVLFWADTKGTYDVSDLTDVKLLSDESTTYEANKDSRDAFSAVESGFTFTGTITKSIYLYRPFAQLNVVFTDLDDLYAQIGSDTEYLKYRPVDFIAIASIPTSFNVMTQTTGNPSPLVVTAAGNYLDNYATHRAEETLFMDYLFASKGSQDVVDIAFSFTSKGQEIAHSFTSIPFQRNYRTNIKGDLMSANARFDVEIKPEWTTPEYNVPYLQTTSIVEAKEYVAPSTAGTVEAKVVNIADGSVQASDVKADKVEDLKVVEFILKATSPKTVSFQLPAVGPNADAWYVTYEAGYPTENVAIDAPEGTKVIINAPNSHVEVTGTSYAQIIASTNASTLVIPEGCAVAKLIIKEGGLEIHGTVETVEIQQTAGKTICVRECEGLSESVYAVLEPFISKGFEGQAQGTTPETYNIVRKAEWTSYAAKSFSQINKTEKTIDIMSEAEFALFAKNVIAGTTYEGWTIRLTKNLDMSGLVWTPVGNFTDNNPFKGTFDGKDMTIKNLNIYSKDKKGVGLFGKVYAPCVLKNIKVEDAVVTAEGTNTYTGGLVGHGYATIEKCSFKGVINGGNQMGGIAAAGGFTIKDCTFDGTINGKYWGLGGIIGNCQDGGEISGNVAKGSIVGTLEEDVVFVGGGIIGCAIYSSTPVMDNYSVMNISFNGAAQTGFPIMGIYNYDPAKPGDTPISLIKNENLLTSVANNSWDKTIFTEDSYVMYYKTTAPVSTGYVMNDDGATTAVTE